MNNVLLMCCFEGVTNLHAHPKEFFEREGFLTLQKLGKELGGLRGRLRNPKFLESAPEDVVAETSASICSKIKI